MQRDLDKEAFLWYALTSVEYLDKAFAKLTEAADFLRRRVKEHDIAQSYPPVLRWLGEMEKLELTYANARSMLEQGECNVMRYWAGSLQDIPRGFAESIMTWMGDADRLHFETTLDRAYSVASDFMTAIRMSMLHFDDPRGDWRVDDDAGFDGSSIQLHWEDFANVIEIPECAADASLSVATGELVPWTGVWIPAEGSTTAALAFARQGQIMQPAYEVIGEVEDGCGYGETRPVDVTWHPFRPTGRMLPVNRGANVSDPLRVAAFNSATQTGWWFTPAKQGSRRHFKQGDVFSDVEGSSYGSTFWQWAPDQSDPKL